MRFSAGPELVAAVTKAGGIAFLGAGETDKDEAGYQKLGDDIIRAAELTANIKGYQDEVLPFGIGFLLNSPPNDNFAVRLRDILGKIGKPPAAFWLFPANNPSLIENWSNLLTSATRDQDVLVIHATDAGGHGLATNASLMTLLPEISDALAEKGYTIPVVAAGGISDGRGVAAAAMLGAQGSVMGTRFLTSKEADISPYYREAVLAASDGGQSTARSKVWDGLRGTTWWPEEYDGRGVQNKSLWEAGTVDAQELKRRFDESVASNEAGWGSNPRAATYAGTGVGLCREEQEAGDIVIAVRVRAKQILGSAASLAFGESEDA
jgi:nitronate monooxygenase